MRRTLIIALTFAALRLHAADATAVLARADAYRGAIDSFAVDVELTSITPSKSETSKFRVYGRGNDRSVVEFTYPQTEKGKYLLMLRDAMWIYLPTTSRPIRISPLQRLMGQASNGDVARTSFTVDYNAVAIGEEDRSYVLDLVAKDTSVAYAKVRLWLDRQSYEPQRADFYVTSGKLIKRAHYREYGQMAGRRVVTTIEIEDLLRAGNRTVMRYANLAARENPEKMFSKDALGRW